MKATIKERLVRSTKWNFLGFLLIFAGGLFLTRYIVQTIGKERFGIWVVAESTIIFFSLFDCGIRTSFVKYIATFWATDDLRSTNGLVNTGFVFYLLFGAAICVSGALLFPALLPFLFRLTPRYVEDARFVFGVVMVIFAADNALRPFTAVIGGLQRYDIENKIKIACFLFYFAAAVYVLKTGYGLRGLVLASAAQIGLQNALALIFSFRLLPGLRFDPFLFRWGFMKLMFLFGIKLQFIKLEELITYHTDSLVLTRFLGPGMAAFYALGSRIAQQVRRACLILDSVIVPASSELDARSEQSRIEELYYRGTKYLCFAAFGSLAFVMVTAPLIMRAWIGEGYGLSVLTMRLLALSYLATIFSEIGRSIAIGINRLSFYLKLSVVHVVLNLGLSIWLVTRIGFAGVLIGTLVAYSITSIIFVVLFHRMLGLSLAFYARHVWLKALLAAAVPSAVVAAVNLAAGPASTLSGARCIALILGEGALFLAIYLALIRRSRFFDAYDINLIHEKVPLSRKMGLLG